MLLHTQSERERESKRNQKPFKSLSGQKDDTTISRMENEEKNTKILTEKNVL